MPDVLRAVMFAAVGVWVTPQLSMAQQTAPPAAPSETTAPVASPRSPVLTITQDRLFSGTLYGQAVQARIEAASQALQAENRKIEADLEAEESTLTTRRAALPPTEFRALADAFDTKVEGIRAAQDAKARALAKSQEQGRQLFFDTAVPILAALMAELGAVAILNKEAIVLSFDTIDITDRAIVRIDAVLGDGSKLPPPTPPAP